VFYREQAPKEHGTSDVSVLVNVTLPSRATVALNERSEADDGILPHLWVLSLAHKYSSIEAMSPYSLNI